MDISLIAGGDSALKVPAQEVVDLTSEDVPALQDVLNEPPPTVAQNGDLESDTGEDDDEEQSESLSLLEDDLEEMGDEHLFNGGKS